MAAAAKGGQVQTSSGSEGLSHLARRDSGGRVGGVVTAGHRENIQSLFTPGRRVKGIVLPPFPVASEVWLELVTGPCGVVFLC